MGLKSWTGAFLVRQGRTVGAQFKNSSPFRQLGHVALALSRKPGAANPLLAKGARYFSQNDEDGILIELLRRAKLGDHGLFIEFGVGNGLENNTIILLALGWKGAWIGADDLAFNCEAGRSCLMFLKKWVTRDNVVALAQEGIRSFGANLQDVRVCSMDLDGNDFYLVDSLLSSGLRPDIFIVEYNAKVSPFVKFVIPYNESHRWQGDDFFGASLLSWNSLFSTNGYRLVACNATGANAFFVKEDHASAFDDVPTNIDDLYVEGNYLPFPTSGHPTSPKTLEQFITRV
jgi:hypothetical protein